MITVDVDDMSSSQSWGRLAVWTDSGEPNFTVEEFLYAVRRERKHAAMGERMRNWMKSKGRGIVVDSFRETMGEHGWQ